MKKQVYLSLTWLWISACSPTATISPSTRLAGSYKFTEYSTASKDDPAPVGVVTLTEIDEQHIDIIVEGTSDKSRIIYSYRNVDLIENGRNYLGEETFSLVYKEKQIGIIDSDEQGRYISLTPKPYVTLVASLPESGE